VVITGTIPKSVTGKLRVQLERKVTKKWTVVARSTVSRKHAFTLTFTSPATSTSVILRARVFRGKKLLATSSPKTLKLGHASVAGGALVSAQSAATPVGVAPAAPAPTGAGPANPAPAPGANPVAVPAASSVTAAPAPGEAGELHLTGTTNLQPGDYLAVGVGPATPDGFLGRVEAVRTEGGETVLTTAPAALTDVVPEGDIDATMADATASTDSSLRSRRSRSADASASASCEASGAFALNPHFSLKKSINFKAHWSLLHGVETASLTGDVTATASVAPEVKGAAHCQLSRTVASFKGTPITFQVGPLPVVLTPNATIELSAHADANADLKAGLSLSATASAGIGYSRSDGLSPIHTFTPSFTHSGPTITGDGSAGASLTPTVNVLVYGVGGPQMAFKAGVELNGDIHANPWWTLTAPIDLTAQLVVPALKLATGKLHVYQHTFDIAHADTFYNTGTQDPVLKTARPVDGGTRFDFVPPAPIEDLTPRNVICQYSDDNGVSFGDCGSTTDTEAPADFQGLFLIAAGRQYRIAYQYDGGAQSGWSNVIAPSPDADIGNPVLTSATPVDGGTRFRFTPPPGLDGLTPRNVICQYSDDNGGSFGDCGSTTDTEAPADFQGLFLIAAGRQYRIAYQYDGGAQSGWSNTVTPPVHT
jgi:hypothetical protein